MNADRKEEGARQRQKMLERDQAILAMYSVFEEQEPDISTERLIAQTADAVECDYGRVVSALYRRHIAARQSDQLQNADNKE